MKLTQKTAREFVRLLGGTLRKQSAGDYRLAFGTNDYFTDDLGDVIGTARAMTPYGPNRDAAEAYLRLETAIDFFKRNAGYSYDPKTETPSVGSKRGARLLADAEAWAVRSGITFEWLHDDDTADADFADTYEYCTAYDANGKVVASLCGIADATADYRRVVQAELALEAMPTAD